MLPVYLTCFCTLQLGNPSLNRQAPVTMRSTVPEQPDNAHLSQRNLDTVKWLCLFGAVLIGGSFLPGFVPLPLTLSCLVLFLTSFLA